MQNGAEEPRGWLYLGHEQIHSVTSRSILINGGKSASDAVIRLPNSSPPHLWRADEFRLIIRRLSGEEDGSGC